MRQYLIDTFRYNYRANCKLLEAIHQLPQKEENTLRDRRLHFDTLLAYLGTATILALFYFQFPIEWVVTSWAAVVFALLGAARLLDRPLFLHKDCF